MFAAANGQSRLAIAADDFAALFGKRDGHPAIGLGFDPLGK